MTESATHSPTPWTKDGRKVLDATGDLVCEMSAVFFDFIDPEYSMAPERDGAFIVHAVNCYDELTSAVENALECLIGCVAPAGGCDDGKTISDTIAILNSALRKYKDG